MKRAREHQRLLSALAFGLLALAAELVGASLTHRIDVGRHVTSPGDSGAVYYPALVAAVKVGIALLSARLVWRLARARATERTARRVLGVVTGEVPRVHITLSPRLWLAFFAIPATGYLLETDAGRVAHGRWPLFFPWVHTSALPVFAVLAVLMAILWSAVQRWLADYEQYAEGAARLARRIGRAARSSPASFRRIALGLPPRRLFGIVFDCRPPPALA
jgi:hypothetical protein